MPSKFGIVLILLLISLSANCAFFFDNRILERIAFSKLNKECVPTKSFHKLVDVCETLNNVNKRDQQLFRDLRFQMEEEDDERKRRRGNGEIRRRTRHTYKGGNCIAPYSCN